MKDRIKEATDNLKLDLTVTVLFLCGTGLLFVPFFREKTAHLLQFSLENVTALAISNLILAVIYVVLSTVPFVKKHKIGIVGFIIILVELYILVTKAVLFFDVVPEIRDGGVVKLVDDFSKGINPYGSSCNYDNGLPFVYVDSGFIHIFPAVFIKMISGLSANQSMIIMSCIYTVLTLFIFYKLMRSMGVDSDYSVFMVGIAFFTLRRYGWLVFRPDIFCVACILLVIGLYIGLNKKESNLRFMLMALLGVILLLTKIHYTCIFIAIFISYLIFNRKYFLKLLTAFLICFAVMIPAVALVFPTFFSTFGVHIIGMLLDNSENGTAEIMIDKWKSLFMEFKPVFIILGGLLILNIKKIGKIFSCSEAFMLFIYYVLSVILLCFCGKWVGATLQYHYVLLMPQILLTSACLLNDFSGLTLKGWKVNTVSELIMILSACYIFVCIGADRVLVDSIPFGNGRQQYEELQAEDNALLCSSFTNYAVENGLDIINYGDIEYIPDTNYGLDKIFPYTQKYYEKYREYYLGILNNIRNAEYSVIYDDNCTFIAGFEVFDIKEEMLEELNRNYTIADTVTIHNESQTITIDVYKRN